MQSTVISAASILSAPKKRLDPDFWLAVAGELKASGLEMATASQREIADAIGRLRDRAEQHCITARLLRAEARRLDREAAAIASAASRLYGDTAKG